MSENPNPISTSQPSTMAPISSNRLTHRVIIFTILFGVTGALGLPLLWFSKSFTTREKIVWSILNSLYTALLIGVTLLIVWWAYTRIFLSAAF